MKLTSRPVEQTQVIRQRNWQEPFIAATKSALGWIRSGLRRSGGFQPPQIGLLSFDRASQRREQSVSLAEPRCHRTFGRLRREPGTSSVVGRRLKKSAGRRFACAAGFGLNDLVLAFLRSLRDRASLGGERVSGGVALLNHCIITVIPSGYAYDDVRCFTRPLVHTTAW